jgi:hypothetical protein
MKPHVCRGVLERFSTWLDSRRNWEQNLIVGVMLLALSAVFAAACHVAGGSWAS